MWEHTVTVKMLKIDEKMVEKRLDLWSRGSIILFAPCKFWEKTGDNWNLMLLMKRKVAEPICFMSKWDLDGNGMRGKSEGLGMKSTVRKDIF